MSEHRLARYVQADVSEARIARQWQRVDARSLPRAACRATSCLRWQ